MSLDNQAFPELSENQGYPGLTKREYAAIHLRVADSGNPELDKMIKDSRQEEIALALIRGGDYTILGAYVEAADYVFGLIKENKQ